MIVSLTLGDVFDEYQEIHLCLQFGGRGPEVVTLQNGDILAGARFYRRGEVRQHADIRASEDRPNLIRIHFG